MPAISIRALTVAAFAASAALPVTAQTQGGSFELELNGAADVGNGCRLTYVATNNTGIALDKTSYEVVIFDGQGAVSRILVLEFGKLPMSKTKVVQFDLADQPCAKISRILVNGQVDCASGKGAQDVCMSELIASSRSQSIQFGL